MPKSNYVNTTIPIERLENAVKISAHVVALYGDKYLPLFNRLYHELTLIKEKENETALALQLALSYSEIK